MLRILSNRHLPHLDLMLIPSAPAPCTASAPVHVCPGRGGKVLAPATEGARGMGQGKHRSLSPSGEKASDRTPPHLYPGITGVSPPVCAPSSACRSLPELKSQMRIRLSSPPLARSAPSRVKANALMLFVCPRNRCSASPVITFQTIRFLSTLAVASDRPVPEKLITVTAGACANSLQCKSNALHCPCSFTSHEQSPLPS